MSNQLRKNISNNPQTITIASIADDLGISKSTVSRVLSGKGRISEETRQKVLNYAEEHNYTPNLLAKGLATSKTFNIGVVLPRDASQTDMPFFHTCLAGITEEASKQNYDILVSLTTGNEIDNIEKTVRNNKVDGIILTRLLQNDQRVKYLQTASVPFLVIGTSDDSEIIQVDSNNKPASIIITKDLIKNEKIYFHNVYSFSLSPNCNIQLTNNKQKKHNIYKLILLDKPNIMCRLNIQTQ